jgi:hypothetical protein
MSIPKVSFNHLYLVLKDSTYRAILSSDFLRTAFPGMERRTTYTESGEWWSGAYYYCQNNYLELFGASAGHWIGGAQEGWAGLAFSVDNPGEAAEIKAVIQTELGYEPNFRLRRLQTGSQAVNWFYLTTLSEQVKLESFDSWVMEYHPDIFDLKGIDHEVGDPLTPTAYLSSWNQPQPDRRFPPIFSRIAEVTLRMAPEPAERFLRVLQLLGYAQSDEDGVPVVDANGTCLRFLPEMPQGKRYRIHSIRLAMTRPSVAPNTFIFAPGSRLVLQEDGFADWYFGD